MAIISVTDVGGICVLKDIKKQTQMAMLSKERDRLLTAVRSYKSLFDTTNQLIAELRSMYLHLLFNSQSVFSDVSVRLSVTEVHWRIIANLGFKFRSHFTAHCGHCATCGRCAARRAACRRIILRHASQC